MAGCLCLFLVVSVEIFGLFCCIDLVVGIALWLVVV